MKRWLYGVLSGDEWQAWVFILLGAIILVSALVIDGMTRWVGLAMGVMFPVLGLLWLRRMRRSPERDS